MAGSVNRRFLLLLVIIFPCLVQANYFLKHGPKHHHGHQHGHKPGPGLSLLVDEKHGHGRSLLMQEENDSKHKHKHEHERHHEHEHHHEHDHKREHEHDHDHKHHGPAHAPTHEPEHHPKHHPWHGPVYAPTHQPEHHPKHHPNDEPEHHPIHRPKHLLLFAHESLKNTSEIQWKNKSRDDKFGRIRSVSSVLREGKSNDSKIVGSQVGIVVAGKEHMYISFTYFLHEYATGHNGTIAVQGFVHDGKAKEDRVLAVVGGTGDFRSVTGVDRFAYHDDNGVDVSVHYLTLDHLKPWP